MTAPVSCPDVDRLRQLLENDLLSSEEGELSAHLNQCQRCQQVLETLVASQEEWNAARLLGDESPGAAGTSSFLDVAKEPGSSETLNRNVAGPAPEGTNPYPFLRPSSQPGRLGQLSHYQVMSVVGQGGMATVFKAFDEELQRVVALKVPAPHLLGSGPARARFLREARAAAAVCHEHVVTIYAVGEIDKVPYLAMQFVAGVSLQDKLDRGGPLDLRAVLRIGMQMAQGLAAAHAQGLVHRDVKPANILLENGVERVKITDFGLARAADDASITQSGIIAGTPAFMSPEQANGQRLDHRSDLFSLGSVLYTLCTGRLPFRAPTAMAVLKRVCEEPPRSIRVVNPDVPDALCVIIVRLMAKNPAERFQTATEVANALAKCLEALQLHGEDHSLGPEFLPPLAAGDTQTWKTVVVPARSRRSYRLWGGLLVAALVLVLCAIAAVFYWPRKEAEPAPIGQNGRVTPGPSESELDRWIPLFNGKSLAGWKTLLNQSGTWKVEDGVLVGSGPNANLFTEQGNYTNFHLRVEVKVGPDEDSGVFFRTPFEPLWNRRPFPYEAQILGKSDVRWNTGSLWGFAAVKDTLVAPDEWFVLEIIARENHFQIKVNDQMTVDFNDDNATFPRGYLAVQHLGTSWVQFRKIEMKRLP